MTTTEMLLAAPGIENFPDLFPRLHENHPRFIGDSALTSVEEFVNALAEAGRSGPATPAEAAERYRRGGELDSLQAVAPDLVSPAAAEWQRETEKKLAEAETAARQCDRERVLAPDGQTWLHAVQEIERRSNAELAGSPGAVLHQLDLCRTRMNEALASEKGRLQSRLDEMRWRLDKDGSALDADSTKRARELCERVWRHIESNDLFLAVQRLEELDQVHDRQSCGAGQRPHRHPLPTRVNPFPTPTFHFENVVTAARTGRAAVEARGLRRFLPDDDAIAQAHDPKEFLSLHANRRVPDRDAYAVYFHALSRWLGIGQQEAGRGRYMRLDLPNLEPKGKLLGRWTFLQSEPWQGAPFFEDLDGRPRILAIVRLGIADADRGKYRVITEYTAQTLNELFAADPVTAQEQRFKQEGLVVVLLPGATLSDRPYAQFTRSEIRLDQSMRADRIAYVDDLDLLRILPTGPDFRFRAFLEMTLPRFRAAVSVTYQNSDAVRPRMFYGRRDEIAKLENGTTIVFSGRRMGKSSLLRRLQSQCGARTDQRAVMVGCSAIGVGRSWQVLIEIERELVTLVHRELGNEGPLQSVPTAGPTTNATADSERAKVRFRTRLDDTMARLAERGVRRIYVLLDEADNFIRAEMEENSGRRSPRDAISWFLRDLQTSAYAGRLRFIFAGYDQLGRVFRDPGLGESAFGHWGDIRPLNLGPLDRESALALVVEPLTALGMPVSPDVAERIRDYTSGHASLIQVFGRRLAEHIQDKEPDWPLNDVPIRYDHLSRIADDERGESNFRQLLEQTLGLNLDIARAYPLRFVFLALVCPYGVGNGKIIGAESFTQTEAFAQLRGDSSEDSPELPDSLVADSLELLVQLGLLEETHSDGRTGREGYRFRAWHYVTVLRTRNGLQATLRQAAADWAAGGRRLPIEPRCLWTLPDAEIHALRRQPLAGPGILVGLPKSGREYAASLIGSPLADGTESRRFVVSQIEQIELWLAGSDTTLAVVSDPSDAAAWEQFRGWMRLALEKNRPIRWVGGARLAWDLAGDVEFCLDFESVRGLGPLTSAELEPWTARPLGADGPGSGAAVSFTEADAILKQTTGLLPVLELFREWLKLKKHGMPDPLTAKYAVEYVHQLSTSSTLVERAVASISASLPIDFRIGLHHLFAGAAEYGFESESPADLMETSEELMRRGAEFTTRVLDAARWLGFVTRSGTGVKVHVPCSTALGVIIRHPRFASPV